MFILGGTDDIQVLLDDSQVGKCVLGRGGGAGVGEGVAWWAGQAMLQ